MVYWTVGLLGLAVAAFAAEPQKDPTAVQGAPAVAGQPLVVHLKYQEVDYPIFSGSLNFGHQPKRRAVTFAKEPPSLSPRVARDFLQLGSNTNDALGLLWDRKQAKLYLDLNRNGDLTDDPAGVFSASTKQYYQVFTNVHLDLIRSYGTCRFRMDLQFADYGADPQGLGVVLPGYAVIRSFYQGSITWQGQTWQIGLVKNPCVEIDRFEEGHLLLRPWADREKPFGLENKKLEAFPLARQLFFNDQSYQISGAVELAGNPPGLALELKPQAVPMGRLQIAGTQVHRLVLEPDRDQQRTVVLEDPPASIAIPAAEYHQVRVWLRKGTNEAFAAFPVELDVPTNGAVNLSAGGPLTNQVAINRQGNLLRMSYRLVGRGGQTYQLTREDRSQPPGFAILKGARKVATGQFEYG